MQNEACTIFKIQNKTQAMIDKLIEMYRQKTNEELHDVIKGGLGSYHPDAIKAAQTVLNERGSMSGSIRNEGSNSSRNSASDNKSSKAIFLIGGGILAVLAIIYLMGGGSSSYGIYENRVAQSVEIYNEGNVNPVSFNVNKEVVSIPANSTRYYKLKRGKNLFDMGDTTFSVTKNFKGIINPAQLPFFFEETVYIPNGMNEDKVKYLKYPFNIFEVDGAMAIGPYKRDTSYILKNYDYGPGEKYPKNIEIRGYGRQTHKFKLYTKKEFVLKQNEENPFFQRVSDWRTLGINAKEESKGNENYNSFIQSQMNYTSKKKQKKSKAQMVIVEVNNAGKKAFVVAKDDGYQALINTEGDFFDPENGNGDAKFSGYQWSTLLGYGSTIRKTFSKVNNFSSPEENFTSFHLQDGYGKHSITVANNKLRQIEFEEPTEKKLSTLFKVAIKMCGELKEDRVDFEVKAKAKVKEEIMEEPSEPRPVEEQIN